MFSMNYINKKKFIKLKLIFKFGIIDLLFLNYKFIIKNKYNLNIITRE